MKTKLTEGDIMDIIYFWNEKGDLERMSNFNDLIPLLQVDYPEVLKAWFDYKASMNIMDAVISNLELKEE